ncbi:helix-turn-helix transcriptional regulator [Corynebacterium comes]|uniref:Uncharacterized protein n=1 Tax=Corynebacterium comes TaxID=2675218 RepID=A0A6B8W061_9CORY|nr:transcriptional regulator [Corynebacterium comes]QGU04336.1 hypothetical protein CETAM_05330 [Corynebacterium comes]
MTDAPAPRPTVELFPEALPLSLKQREVLGMLQTFPRGARSAELAGKLGMHVNTVRGHLDELVDRGAVRVTSTPAEGRGRPSHIFRVRVPDNRAVAREYVTLVEVLASVVAETGNLTPETLSKAREIGRIWAHKMEESGETPEELPDVLDLLYVKLRDMGFDPVVSAPKNEAGQLSLHSCPFVTGDQRPSPFICAIHEGFLREATGSRPDGRPGAVSLTLLPYADGGACVVRVDKNREEEDTL